MTASVADLQARLADLNAAIASGALIVRHGETSTTFRGLKEMERTKRLKQDIATAGGTTRTRRPGYVYQSGKGL